MTPPANGWEQWQRHVLSELERLNDCYARLEKKTHCDVHSERIDNLSGKVKLNTNIIITVIICGIVLGLWIKVITG